MLQRQPKRESSATTTSTTTRSAGTTAAAALLCAELAIKDSQTVKHGSREEPGGPHPSFLLTAHNNGRGCKKIRGKVNFFGTRADPQAALDRDLRVAADIHAGRQPVHFTLSGQALTVKDVCNHYLIHQRHKPAARRQRLVQALRANSPTCPAPRAAGLE